MGENRVLIFWINVYKGNGSNRGAVKANVSNLITMLTCIFYWYNIITYYFSAKSIYARCIPAVLVCGSIATICISALVLSVLTRQQSDS